MNSDERAIRELVETWQTAMKAGDLKTVLGLIADDVVCLVPGREPIGKDEFAAASRAMQGVAFEGTSEIVELEIAGAWAWIRNRLRIVVTPPGGEPMRRSGYTLNILRKNQNGQWQVARYANLLGPDTDPVGTSTFEL